MNEPTSESSEPSSDEKNELTMGDVVDMLPKDGSPLKIGGTIFTYHGEFPMDADWNS